MKTIMIMAAILILSACSQYKWVKPGSSDMDLNKELTSCQAKALVDLPPANVIYESRSFGYEKKADKENTKKEKNENYNTRTINNINDANSQQRDIIIRDCMFSRGWNEIIISN